MANDANVGSEHVEIALDNPAQTMAAVVGSEHVEIALDNPAQTMAAVVGSFHMEVVMQMRSRMYLGLVLA
jgi:hypothetical protein